MTYGYYGNTRSRKQSRSKTKQLEVRKILASLTMAAGILASPFSVGEAAIVRKDGTEISHSNNVYNIDPEGKNSTGDFAYNRFQQFALDAGQIANLRFDTASTLANLVNNRVTINGIVNAVKGGAIDGHLIFLSPNGIAVGSSGVINAGQFTGIVPTLEAFNKLYNTQTPATDITLAAINQIKDGAYAAVKTDDEGVVQGTIDIRGQINTHSGVMLGAGIINIKDGAKIQSTKNLDFTNLVNIQSGANAGLGTLTKVEGSGGDIILGAKQSSVVKDTKTVQDTNNQETTEAHAIRWSERSTDLSAAVNIGKDATTKGVQITSSAGAVKLTAESSSTYEDSTPMTLTGTMKTAIFGSEETAFDGLLDKLAAGEAGANKYLLFNYSNKKNKSAVNIGTNSTITGNSIDVAANSKVEIKQSVTVPELPIGEDKKDSNGNVIPSGSKVLSTVTVSRVDNKADIVVDGNLKATGADEAGSGIKIAANADTKVELAAGGNGGDANAVAVGVAVLAGDTKANVVVNDKVTENAQPGENDLSATAGKVSVEATTGSDIDVNVVAKGTQSYVVSNVGVAN
jgi:filamentous hemagglutinin family protein